MKEGKRDEKKEKVRKWVPKSILLRVTPDGITVQGLRPFPGSHSRSSNSSSSSSSGGGGGSSGGGGGGSSSSSSSSSTSSSSSSNSSCSN